MAEARYYDNGSTVDFEELISMEGVPEKDSKTTKLASHLIGQAEKARATTTKKKGPAGEAHLPRL